MNNILIWHFFLLQLMLLMLSAKRAGDHVKNPQKQKIFCKFGPKNIQIGRPAGGKGVFESGDF
jgi:hypothetical protein